jgi:hypothetical protein
MAEPGARHRRGCQHRLDDGYCEETIDTLPGWCACDRSPGRALGEVAMLEYLEYAAFLIAVFGCLYYIMNSLETEDLPKDPER